MSTTSKLMIGLGIASGALLTAWLLSGDRGKKTKQFVVKKADVIKESLKKEERVFDDSEVHYV